MMKYEEALSLTAEPTWVRLLVNTKQEALQSIEKHIAEFEGRPERGIVIENMDEGYYGYYNHSDSSHIHISPLALRTPEEAIKTVLHEGRHAYQHDCLDRNDGFPQPILQQFREGFEHYVSPEENFKAYANNFTEVDAEDFAEKQSQLLDMERDALLHKEHDHPEEHKLTSTHKMVSEDNTIERDSLPVSETLSPYEANPVGRYDWVNQTTFPEMGRELEKVKGGSETETLVTDLRDIPMSPQDFQQYFDYFSSEEVSRRPVDQRHSMALCLQEMGLSLSHKDEIGYYESRNHFLENDAYYRVIEQDRGKEVHSDSPSIPRASLASHGKRYQSTYAERIRHTPSLESNRWNGERGESVCAPQSDAARQILEERGIDGVQYHNGMPDFSPFSESTVKLGYMTDARHSQGVSEGRDGENSVYAHFEDGELVSESHRADKSSMGDLHMKYDKPGNFEQADILTAEQWTANGRDGKEWNAKDVAQYRQDHGLTWHECNDMETMQMIPEAINADFGHLGGVGEVKQTQRIVDETLRDYDEGQMVEDDDYDRMSSAELKTAAREEGHYSDEGIWVSNERSVEHSERIIDHDVADEQIAQVSKPDGDRMYSDDLHSRETTSEKDTSKETRNKVGIASFKSESHEEGKQANRSIERLSQTTDDRIESKMSMTPSASIEHGVEERTEPEMNMAPSASIEYGVVERTEPEMNMAPSASVEHGVAERTEPEMNMAPSASVEHGVVERAEPEMNMAPSAFIEHGVAERTEPEMNMAPSGFEEREASDHTEPNMDQQESTQIKPDNIRDTNDEAQSVGESTTQDMGMSW